MWDSTFAQIQMKYIWVCLLVWIRVKNQREDTSGYKMMFSEWIYVPPENMMIIIWDHFHLCGLT